VRTGPLSGAQEFEWWKTINSISVHNVFLSVPVPAGTSLGIAGVAALLSQLMRRHETLRTTVRLADGGVPVQVVQDVYECEVQALPVVEDGESQRLLDEFRYRAVDAGGRLPFRAAASVAGPRVTEIHLALSHVVFDGYSIDVAANEIRELLVALGNGADAKLPPVRRQPVDSAVSEVDGPLRQAQLRAADFWQAEVRMLPNRLFAPVESQVLRPVSTTYSSVSGPAALLLAARRCRTTPVVVYTAAMHALLHLISGHDVTVIREHIAGRTAEERSTLGCYHQILPVRLDLSDRPTLMEIIQRTERKSRHVQLRGRISYLRMREMMALEQYRRGTAFADGTTINVMYGHKFAALKRDSDAMLIDRLRSGGDPELELAARDIEPNPWGLDAYLMTQLRHDAMRVTATFNADVLRPAQMHTLLAGPERILARLLRSNDLTLDEIADEVGPDVAAPVPPRWSRISPDIVVLSEVRRILRCHPEVSDAWVTVCSAPSGDQQLVAYVAARTAELDVATLRTHVLQHATPTRCVVCPHVFVVCDRVPDAPDRPDEWLRQRRLDCGSGRPDEPSRPWTVTERVMHDAVRAATDADAVDMGAPYVATNAGLLRAPAILARIREAGYLGLCPDDFATAVPLAGLASRLREVPEPGRRRAPSGSRKME
jgi:hypothetical protein